MEKQWTTWFAEDCPSLVQDSVNHYADGLPHRDQVSTGELADFLEKDTLCLCVHGSDYVHVISSITNQPIAKLQWQYPPDEEGTAVGPINTPKAFAGAVEKLMEQAPASLQVICYVADVDADKRELQHRVSQGVALTGIFELLYSMPELLRDVKRIVNNWETYQQRLEALKNSKSVV